jgi:hypothetical protein
MSAKLQLEDNDIMRVTIAGTLCKTELEEIQGDFTRELLEAGTNKVLIVLDKFEGWEAGADWGDSDFYFTHGDSIRKIGIVGDEKWRAEALIFAGAGVREASVRFFPTEEIDEAHTWLSQAIA